MSFAVEITCTAGEWEDLLAGWPDEYPIQGVVETAGAYRVFFASRETAARFAESHAARVEEVPEESYVWWQDWQPLLIGERFFLCPAWIEEPAPPGRLRLEMVGANVFGGGEHATTQLCLELLERAVTPGMRVLDVGTGTGILSAAARALGAGRVYACDVEPAAVRLAAAHAHVWQGSADSVRPGCADLVVCNIHLAVLREVLPELRRLGAPLLLSGFLEEQVPELTAGLAVAELRRRDGWCAVLAFAPLR